MENTTIKKHVIVLLIVSSVIVCSSTVYFENVLSSSSLVVSVVFNTFRFTVENLDYLELYTEDLGGSSRASFFQVSRRLRLPKIDFLGAARMPPFPRIDEFAFCLCALSFRIFDLNFSLLLHSLYA